MDKFIADYTDPRWPGTESFLLRHIKGGCIFLQASIDNLQLICLIHPFKPRCCLDWASGLHQPECREGLRTKWDLFVDSSGNLTGTPENIAKFTQFLKFSSI